ncbi:hypothetical protein [Amycolatopsis decaplanina]|uniref:SD-repeat containing protein B domain-containing protein n=1 Tax=Amycolatopsis decaplanina DSM 44594 TaxID=1284240 RepID=M2ZHK9_9PSEU|nr:hypothetical protein [Amycolatopsis decaplanina]EME60393.1 hypothetical protein H074_15242 [Amycolatopsis decaplanina DSM 44594]
MRRTLPGRSLPAVGALTLAFTLTGAVAAVPAHADPGPNLKITAGVPDGRWLRGETIPIDLTITNIGDAPANEVKAQGSTYSGPYYGFDQNTWGELHFDGPGASFQAGESRTYRLTGRIWGVEAGNPVARIEALTPGDADYTDNVVDVPVNVVPPETTERVAGQVYGDKNRDGVLSPGEELAGITARVGSFGMPQELSVVTDAAGRFSFDAVPVGPNRVLYFRDVPDGWLLPEDTVMRLDGSGKYEALSIRGQQPLSQALQAKIELDKTSYVPGETAKATVTLTNSGAHPLSGLFVTCGNGGTDTELKIPQEQWGAFGSSQAGALTPGQRVVLPLTAQVPEKASYFGKTSLHCDFNGKTYLAGPQISVEAKVPGKRADARGLAWVDKNNNYRPDDGEGLAGITATLSTRDNKLVSFARTDAKGYVTFPGVAVGEYVFRVAAPWKAVQGDSTILHVAPPYGWDWSVQMEPR